MQYQPRSFTACRTCILRQISGMHVHYRRTCLMINDYKNIYYVFLIDPGKQPRGVSGTFFRNIYQFEYNNYRVTSIDL